MLRMMILSASAGAGHRDLAEVTLVDIVVVRFLVSCENEGIELVYGPAYVREWIIRERAECAQPEPCHHN